MKSLLHAASPGRAALALALTAACLGCSAVTPPPRFSAVSPADGNAPEAASPLPAPVLSMQPESEASPQAAPQSDPHAGHEGHGQPATPTESPEGTAYTCPHHPEIQAQTPGSCPRCGARLVRKPATEPRR